MIITARRSPILSMYSWTMFFSVFSCFRICCSICSWFSERLVMLRYLISFQYTKLISMIPTLSCQRGLERSFSSNRVILCSDNITRFLFPNFLTPEKKQILSTYLGNPEFPNFKHGGLHKCCWWMKLCTAVPFWLHHMQQTDFSFALFVTSVNMSQT